MMTRNDSALQGGRPQGERMARWMHAWHRLSGLLLLTLATVAGLPAAQDPPQLRGHPLPPTHVPDPAASWHAWFDVLVLVLALSLASWLVLKRRSRRGVWVLMVACLLYFGFYRAGCICPVGSVQNVAQGLFATGGYAVPLTVLLFFLLPLIAALLWGRVFCAAVCPLGAVQDVVHVRTTRLPTWFEHALGLVPYLFLGVALVLAVAGAGYVICRFDPFIPIFRLGGPAPMVILAVLFVGLSLFIGRPYCRFLCPYGVLLRWASLVARRHLEIYPEKCINCRLCEDSCPYEAIVPSIKDDTSADLPTSRRWLVAAVLAVPLLMVASGYGLSRLSGPLAAAHHEVQLAGLVFDEDLMAAAEADPELLDDDTRHRIDAWHERGIEPLALRQQALAISDLMRRGLWLVGLVFGLAVGVKLVQLCLRWRPDAYHPDRGRCLSCARCFDYCPGSHPAPEADEEGM